MIEDIERLNREFENLSFSKYGRNPIYDGIVDLNSFLETETKILWILKEVNSTEDEGGWDIREAIKELKTEYGLKSGWQRTFTSIVYVSEGIINHKSWNEIPYLNDNPKTIDILKNIAFINLKKVTGLAKANPIELYEAYKIYRELLIKQIDLINPDIIIFGGTYTYFREDFPNSNIKQFGSCNIFRNGDKIFIDAYHPQYFGISQEKYFNDIINAISFIKQ